MLTVDFSCEDVFGIIVPGPTGVCFSNQAGGGLCLHPSEEGFFVPINSLTYEDICRLHSMACGESVDVEEADQVLSDLRLPLVYCSSYYKSFTPMESWIPVTVSETDESSPLFSLNGMFAVLTYPNCD